MFYRMGAKLTSCVVDANVIVNIVFHTNIYRLFAADPHESQALSSVLKLVICCHFQHVYRHTHTIFICHFSITTSNSDVFSWCFSQREYVIHSELRPQFFHPIGVFLFILLISNHQQRRQRKGLAVCQREKEQEEGEGGRERASERAMEAEGEGWRRGADKERRTNERGRKDKREQAVYRVLFLLRAQQNTERGGVTVSQKIITRRHRRWKL